MTPNKKEKAAPEAIETSVGMETADQTLARAKNIATPRITPGSLQPTPEVRVTPTPPPVQAPALEAGITAQTDQFTEGLTQKRKDAESGKTTALTDYITQLKGAQTQSSLQNAAFGQEGGVDDISVELNDINDQIRVEQRALQNARRAVSERGGGLATGAAAEIGNLERVSLQKQADLAVIQMGVQGRYDSAREIADRSVKVQMEQQSQLLDVLKFNYQENKEVFTQAEQREFDTLLANRTREIQAEEDRIKEIKDFALKALEAGASVSETKQMMGAKTLDEAMSIGGSYFRPKPTGGEASAPTIKSINGVDYQWNPTTGTWEVPGVTGASTSGLSADQEAMALRTISLADELMSPDTSGKGAAVGASVAKLIPFAKGAGLQGGRVSFEEKINTFKAATSLENLSLLKGPMSDKDLAFIQSISTSLNPNMSEAEFDKEVKKVKNVIQDRLQPKSNATVWGVMAPNETPVMEGGQPIIIID